MGIKAADVKKLRDKTGAGMLDCKNALAKADGDFNKAEKILKELGLAAAAKRSGRATNQGRIFTKISSSRAVILEIGCETDFVARNNDFIALGEDIATTVIDKNISNITAELEEKVKEAISKIKENMSLKRLKVLDIAENELVVDYIHGEGSIGILIKLTSDKPEILKEESVKTFAFDCALHIAAFNPQYQSRDDVPAQYIKEQEDIFLTQAKNLGRPEKVLEGIVKGKLNKHFSEICFLDQPFVKDDKQSVAKVMAAIAREAGGSLAVAEFVYYKVGGEE